MKYLLTIGLMFCFLSGCGGDDNTVPSDGGIVVDVAIVDVSDAPLQADHPTPLPDGGWPPGSFDQNQAETSPMFYNGGPVMISPINVYFIWYGNWTDTKTAPVLEDLMKGIGNSAWFQINTGYYQQSGVAVSDAGGATSNLVFKTRNSSRDGGTQVYAGQDAGDAATVDAGLGPRLYVSSTVNFLKSVYIGYTHGNILHDNDMATIVSETIQTGKLPPDPDGVYFILTSFDVSEFGDFLGFCTDYCGWHGNYQVLGIDIKLIFVGDTNACSDVCSMQLPFADAGILKSPNDDWSADGMASVMAHELTESATDPDALTTEAWVDFDGEENADKCAWTFGPVYSTANKSLANVPIGNRDFIIQQNWVLDGDGGHCDLHP